MKMDLTFVPVPGPHIADYIVIAVFLSICMGIGVYYGYQTNKNPTLDNYFLGNRRLVVLPVAISLFVTFASAISIMGIPADIYVYGIRGSYLAIPYFLSVMIASVTVVPLLYPLRLTSTYEYLQLRFHSKAVRTMGTIIGMLQTIFYMGVVLYAPGLALQTVAGIPLWLSIVVIGLVGTIYTAIGGIKSVVWTDVFQCLMIFVGLGAITIKGSMLMRNHSVLEIATKGRRLEFFNFDPDPQVRHTIWGFSIGLTFGYIANWCNQSSVQRVSSLRSLKSAKRVFWLMGPIILCYFSLLGYLGILLYSYYHTLKCDPVKAKFLSNSNQLMPYFVLDVLRSLPGLSGVYISCLFSAALSTLSSGINALSANSVEDILGDYLKESKRISLTLTAKLFVFAYGVIVIGLAFAINSMSGSIVELALAVFGACGGPLAGLFFLGAMVPKANWIGGISGSLIALVFNMWIAVGAQLYGAEQPKLAQNPTSGCFPNSNNTFTTTETLIFNYNASLNTTPYGIVGHQSISTISPVTSDDGFSFYNVSYVWYGLIGFFVTMIIGIVVSLLTGGDRGEPVEACYIFPICRKMYGLKAKYDYDAADVEEKTIHLVSSEANGVHTTIQRNDDGGASLL